MLRYLFDTNPILIIAAVVPAVLLLVQIYRADRLEKEPRGLLVKLLLMGLLSTGLAAVTEQIGEGLLVSWLDPDSLAHRFLLFFVVVAVSEEGFKYLLLRRATWRHGAFNCQFDGVVYAVFVSLGFALWENIGYVAIYGFSTALVRAVTAVPGHACFGVFMGAWYGQAKRYDLRGDEAASRRSRHKALWLPMLLHGTYDFVASSDSELSALVFLAFIVIMYVVAIRKVRRLSREDDYITPPENDWLV